MSIDLAERVCYVYVARVIAALGITGNILNLLTLRRRTLNDSPYTYLTALAVAELFVLLLMTGIGLVRCGSCMLNERQLYAGRVYEYFIYLPVINMAHHSATFITVAMTVERFVFVRCPLIAKNVCTKGKARVTIIFVVLIAVAINLPRFFMFTLRDPAALMAQLFVPSFIVMECSLPLPYVRVNNITSNFSFAGPRCVLSKLTSRNVSEYSLESLMQDRVKEKDLFLIDSIDTLQKLIGGSLIAVHDVRVGRCRKENSKHDKELEDYYDADGDEFVSIANWTMSKYSMIEPIRYFTVPNFTWENFIRNIASEKNQFKHENVSSLALSPSTIVQDGGEKEIHVMLNITSNDVLVRLINKLPCISKPNKISNTTTSKPTIIHATSAVVVSTTPFYNSSFKLMHYSVIVFEMAGTIVMGLLNLALIKVLRKSLKNRQKLIACCSNVSLRTNLHDQQRLTVTLVIVTTFTALTTFLSTIISDPVAKNLFGDKFMENDVKRWLTIVNNLVGLTNNSINFALYALFNTRFRREFRLAVRPLTTFIRWLIGSHSSLTPSHKDVSQTNSNCSTNAICARLSSNNLSDVTTSTSCSDRLDDVAL